MGAAVRVAPTVAFWPSLERCLQADARTAARPFQCRPPRRTGTVSAEGAPVRVYVTAVTGGSSDKPTRGVNVCITGTAEAVRRLWRETEREAREEAAYESGDPTAIEAAME